MKKYLFLFLLFLSTGAHSKEHKLSIHIDLKENNYGSPYEYEFNIEAALNEQSVVDIVGKTKIDLTAEMKTNHVVLNLTLYDYIGSTPIIVGYSAIEIIDGIPSTYQWKTQNGNTYKLKVTATSQILMDNLKPTEPYEPIEGV